uniref:Uncharacterized protein n=1 Tax=Branchiostoma floridae TaxID=7739 RepID=C3XUK1_BRAFL|eukprot:XP_002612274.1 hypothetical protein BRAFLDRAFT_104891 [Branchiostoma floridae]
MPDSWEVVQKCAGFVVVISAAALILTGALVVHPMLENSTLSYRPTVCKTSYSYKSGGEACWCGKNCKSVARCLVVMVTMNSSSPALLVQSEEVMRVSDKCSLYYCLRDKDRMDRLVEEFQTAYGQQGQKYRCLYNAHDPQVSTVLPSHTLHCHTESPAEANVQPVVDLPRTVLGRPGIGSVVLLLSVGSRWAGPKRE